MRRRATFIFALILAIASVSGRIRAADAQPSEYQLKAAYIYHFAQFVDWPPAAFAQTNSPLIIGIFGENPFGAALQNTVKGKTLGGHALSVQEFHSVTDLTNSCHILFISSSEKKRLPEIFQSLTGASVLTVGEADHFTEAGGMIGFVMDGTKIRFQINATIAEKAGLKMSFKLLSLASRVTR